MSGGGEDFSEDTTNGGFSNDDNMGNTGEECDMMAGVDGDMNQDDSMQETGDGSNNQNENGEGGNSNGDAMESNSNDTGSADQYGKDDDRKLFIGGLSWETTEKDLRDYFAKYGAIESLTLKMDPNTGRSRGFAFIVFSDVSTLDSVIAAGDHVINGKKVDPKKAKARHGKIFVGGLTSEITDEEIKSYFSKYGNVVEMEMPIDKIKNQRKGFCFITFDNEQVVHELLKQPKQKIQGKEVDVKKAQPPQNARGMMAWGGMGMSLGRGGRGAVRGGGRGRGRGDYWSGSGYGGYGGYGPQGSFNTGYDYYGGGYGGYNYGYGDGGYYDSSYYEGFDTPPMSRGGRGGRGGYSGKTRGTPRGQPRHMPY